MTNTAQFNAEAGTEQIAAAFRTAGEWLTELHQRNEQAKLELENGGWSGMDEITAAAADLQAAEDKLAALAEKVGLQGQALREAREAAANAGDRSTIVDS